MTSRHGHAADVTAEVLAAAALFRASRDPAHLGHLFAAMARSPRPSVLTPAFIEARNALETLGRHVLACAQLAGAIEAIELPTPSVMRAEPANDGEPPQATCDRLGIDVPKWAAEIRAKIAAATAALNDDDEPSVADEEEARLARLRASTIPPPPDTQRSRELDERGELKP